MLRSRLLTLTRIVHNSRNVSTSFQNRNTIKTNNFTEFTRKYSSSSQVFTEVTQVFERIKQVSNPSIVKKVDAVYVFDVEGEGKWHLDLTKGSGQIGQGAPTKNPDVTVVVNKEIFLKMFNRELKPATAFMSGKLKLSGDLSKALALESVMKASRDDY